MLNKPKLRFKEFNDKWNECSMDNCGTFLKGNNLSKADLTDTGYPCLLYGELYTKYSEVTTNIMSFTNRFEQNQVIGNRNDVLIPSSGETAIDISTATCLQVDNVLLGGDLNIFRPNKQDGRFVSYELNHKKRRKIACIAQGATVVHLYPNYLKKLKLTLPTIEEQKKIAEFLSKVDEVITERKEEIKDLEKQKKGLMQKIFSQQLRFIDSNNSPYPNWEEKSFNDYCLSISSGKSKKRSDSGVYNLYGSTGIIGKIDTVDYSGKYLLVARVGANAGYTYKIDDKCGISDNTLVINLKSNLLIDYIYYYFRNWNLNRLIFGSGQPLVTGGMLKKIKVKIPCLEEQQKIANVLSKMDELIEEKKALLSDWQSFKKGLLQQMFI